MKDVKGIILTDADGVLLDWSNAFTHWMKGQGFSPITGTERFGGGLQYDMSENFGFKNKGKMQDMIRTFNESARIGYLEPHKDAYWGVKKLHEAGYVFHVITSLSTDKWAGMARTQNLKNIFGDVFDKFVYLDTGADKDEALAEYKDTGLYWIEDKPDNAKLGASLGLKAVLLEHAFSKNIEIDNVTKVNSWSNICDLILDH
tara:strand:+ start:246 stop:851 length:606 start_codon:yes stop_codon:yes gene_type:complete